MTGPPPNWLVNHMVKKNEQQLDRIFYCLADPTRRSIIRRIRGGDKKVGELAEPLKMTLPAVSKHLKILEETGLISRKIQGREHFIHLNGAPLREAMNWIADYRPFWDNRLKALEKELGGLKW